MFDSFSPKPSRRRRIFYAVSGGLHVAAIGALAVATMWRVDKLTPDAHHNAIAVMPPTPPGNSGGGQKMADPKKPAIRKPKPQDPIQPVPHQQVAQEPIAIADPGTGEPGTGGGGDGKGFGEPTSGGGCLVEPCGIGDPPPVVPLIKPCSERPTDADCLPPPPLKVERVPEVALGARISGDAQIHPPDSVTMMMGRDGKSQTRGTFKMCLDTGGAVTSVSALRSTGYDAYDDRLVAGMQTWRYAPYKVNGTPVAVCTVVTFVYAIR